MTQSAFEIPLSTSETDDRRNHWESLVQEVSFCRCRNECGDCGRISDSDCIAGKFLLCATCGVYSYYYLAARNGGFCAACGECGAYVEGHWCNTCQCCQSDPVDGWSCWIWQDNYLGCNDMVHPTREQAIACLMGELNG